MEEVEFERVGEEGRMEAGGGDCATDRGLDVVRW